MGDAGASRVQFQGSKDATVAVKEGQRCRDRELKHQGGPKMQRRAEEVGNGSGCVDAIVIEQLQKRKTVQKNNIWTPEKKKGTSKMGLSEVFRKLAYRVPKHLSH